MTLVSTGSDGEMVIYRTHLNQKTYILMKEEKKFLQVLGMAAPTKKHQIILGRIYKNYLMKYESDHMLTDTAIVAEPERVPDISVWEYAGDEEEDYKNPLLTIEITHTLKNDCYSAKSINETFQYVPSLHESFIYNYEKNQWTRYRREGNEIVKESDQDYSQVLKCYLHTLLK